VSSRRREIAPKPMSEIEKSKEYRKIEARRVGGNTGQLRSVQLLKISHDKILVQISFDETAAK